LFKDRQPTQKRVPREAPNGEVRCAWGPPRRALIPRTRGADQRRDSGHHEPQASEERQTLLAREVDHPPKSLAVVQSIVRADAPNTIEEFTSAVEGRIRSLSLAHTILSLSRWQGADLRRPG